MLAPKLLLAISSLLTLAVLFLCCINLQPIAFNCLGAQLEYSLGLIIFAALLIGSLIGLSLTWLCQSKKSTEKHVQQWSQQDAKLAAEVKSDCESQLEAKIVTLEIALKQALKKA